MGQGKLSPASREIIFPVSSVYLDTGKNYLNAFIRLYLRQKYLPLVILLKLKAQDCRSDITTVQLWFDFGILLL